jgi:hypothetical protein
VRPEASVNLERAELEHALVEAADVYAAIAVRQDEIVLTGMVSTPGEHQTAIDILRAMAPEAEVVDNLVIGDVWKSGTG